MEVLPGFVYNGGISKKERSMDKKPDIRILVTCFTPARGKKQSASKEALSQLRPREHGVQIFKLELPHAFGTCVTRAWEMAENTKPDAILLVGEAPGRAGVSVERVAVNLTKGSRKGSLEKRIRRDGPDAYFATIPVQEVRDEIVEAGIPAEISMSAGTDVENDLFFGVLDRAKLAGGGIQVGLLQLPCLPEEAVTPYGTLPSMGKTVSGEAAERAVRAIAQSIRREKADD